MLLVQQRYLRISLPIAVISPRSKSALENSTELRVWSRPVLLTFNVFARVYQSSVHRVFPVYRLWGCLLMLWLLRLISPMWLAIVTLYSQKTFVLYNATVLVLRTWRVLLTFNAFVPLYRSSVHHVFPVYHLWGSLLMPQVFPLFSPLSPVIVDLYNLTKSALQNASISIVRHHPVLMFHASAQLYQ